MAQFLPKNFSFNKLKLPPQKSLILIVLLVLIGIVFIAKSFFLNLGVEKYKNDNNRISQQLQTAQKELYKAEHEDQFVKNKKLEDEIKNIYENYKKVVSSYEDILDLKIEKGNTIEIDKLFAQSLNYLSERNYSSASAAIAKLNDLIKKQTTVVVQGPAEVVPANVTQSNQAPGSGFSRQAVSIDSGSFTVDIVAADLNSTRVIVDTASDNDCGNDCPVLPLATYVARNGAFAGINGTYFCPASYPTCAGKTNSFDLLVMNKNKHYFNSDNNVYSTNPAVIFSGNSARFVGQALQWGRDTGVDGVISNFPMLVSGGNPVADGGGKGPKNFVGAKGSTVYIGIVRNATTGEAARVLQALGLENALGLDQGGSTALWSGGYKAGPGRDIPNAILFVSK